MTKRSVARTPSGDWHPEEIKAAVRIQKDPDGRPWSLGSLAIAAGLPEHACRTALRGSDAKGEAAIAILLDLTPRDIWPTRYDRNGARINPPRRSGNSFSLGDAPRHCENQEAA
ncbi:helix-turn-helix domain-containing protein [Mesorhizobium sp. KR1-2]|uniref:helix-turn-helix domain-containing protein n=1 Tax=Mesorhizobium sp. KR1-2 TaxID=3156609 RepID=UPI0032B58995